MHPLGEASPPVFHNMTNNHFTIVVVAKLRAASKGRSLRRTHTRQRLSGRHDACAAPPCAPQPNRKLTLIHFYLDNPVTGYPCRRTISKIETVDNGRVCLFWGKAIKNQL